MIPTLHITLDGTPDTNAEPITKSDIAATALQMLWPPDRNYIERFFVLYVNRANVPIASRQIAQGGINACMVDVRCILQGALLCNASAIVLAHNHPSGSATPSNADATITKKIKEAACIMDIVLLDHIILTPGSSYFSFADNGML